MDRRIKGLIRLLRPHQWIKNIFVFLPLFFSGHMFDTGRFLESLVAFLSFCLAASAVYCLNDLKDVEADRAHPVKCRRPVASGDVPPLLAAAAGIALCVGALVSALILPAPQRWLLMCVVAGYMALNVCYCLWLKRIAIVDVAVVAAGFVLRIAGGGAATGIILSPWIVLMTFLLALFLALSKRRDDVLRFNEAGVKPRHNTDRYNLDFLGQANTLVAGVTLVCYILYTMSESVMAQYGSRFLYVTSLFVLLGILRYFQATLVDGDSGSPTRLVLRDRFLQCCIAGWVITFLCIIYF